MALPSNTFASPGVSFYATANESAKNWYQFPALNGIIQMVDASGTQILHSIDANLYYNNELLAKANDIQDVADWSLYPALQTVELAGQDITQANNITATSTITANVLDASSATITGIVSANTLATVPGPFTSGDVKTQTVTASGLVSAGSVSASGNVQGGSMTTTGGLDMANTAVSRASAVNLSANGFAPYGALSSPDGALLTWNGATINTGGAGSAANWANFPAITNINANTNNITNIKNLTGASANITDATIGTMSLGLNQITGSSATPMVIKGDDSQPFNMLGGSITETSTTGDITLTSYNSVNVNSGNDFRLVADGGINPIITPSVSLTSKNGNGGQINLTADPGSVVALGGAINITANGGTVYVPQTPPAPPLAVTVGGEVNIFANTGGGGLYTLTSAVNIAAGGVNSYAGAIPPIGSLAGYNFIYGTAGVNVCAGLPSAGFQLPATTYIYGTGVPGSYGGVRLQSPNGIQMLSDTYMTNLYPVDTDGLNIGGRTFLGSGYVNIADVATFTMNGGAALKTDNITSVSGAGILYTDNFIPLNNTKGIYTNFVKPIQATAPGVPNLVISNNPFLGNNNYVEIVGADAIGFDATGTGAITGLKSINGAAWPPPTGDASLWSQYPATSAVDISGYGLTNVSSLTGVSSINGIPYVTNDTNQWATYPAVQNVDMSSNSLSNLASITTLDGFTITSAGSIGLFADTPAGNISIATNGGGNVNIGTGNAGDINITTSGAGNEVDVGGDVVNLNGTQGVRVSAPVLDMIGNNIYNVATLRGSLATEMRVATTGAGLLSLESDTGGIQATTNSLFSAVAGTGVNLTATTQNVTVNAGTGIIELNSPTVTATGAVGAASVSATGAITAASVSATGDVVSSSAGSTPYSLNTIGALVNGNQLYNYWVAVNGSDTTGTGSAIRPFASVSAALAATVSISDTIPINICLTAGTYTENPTMTRNNTFIQGSVGIADCVIVGTFTFNSSSSSTVSQGLTGVTVVGNVVCSESTSSDTSWYIQNCNITSYGTVALAGTSTGAGNNGIILYNTVVTQNVTPNAAITINSVRLNAIQSQINNTTTGSSVSCSGTGSMSLFGVTMTCAGSATASPIIAFTNLTTNGTASSFTLCTFTYTQATAGSGKTAVFFNNSAALAGLTVFNQNVFNMIGSTSLILKPGAGSVAIQWGTNSSNILTVPAASPTLTYTYLPSTPLRANALYDISGNAGTANQVLTAGTAGGVVKWASLTNSSLGVLPAEPAATSYQNQLVFYNTATQSLAYGAADYQIQLITAPNAFAPFANQRGLTLIVTSAAAANLTLANTGLLTANDAGFFFTIKNGNGTLGGDITITGGITTGNTVIHNQTAVMNGGSVIVRWTGTAFVAY